MAIRPGGRGVARVLQQVLPLMVAKKDGLDPVIVTSSEGRRLLGELDAEIVEATSMPKSLWEQWGLPREAKRLGAKAIYIHSECSPLWGPPVLLHVPEDPYIRWQTTPVTTWREHARRAYQRTTMSRSVRRAPIVVTSCEAVTAQLRSRFGPALGPTSVVPLGVDSSLFHGEEVPPREDMVFHLGSDEPRDQSAMVVQAFADALEEAADLPDLVIAGKLGRLAPVVTAEAQRLGLKDRVRLVGRITDDELRHSYYHAAACLQPARYEGFGLQPLEALACASPLIVFAEDAVKEVVGDASVIVEDRRAPALGHALAALWADTGRRSELRRRGPLRAARYPWEATAEGLRALLEDIV